MSLTNVYIKLCKKRLLALILSAAMIFTSADIRVLASETVWSNSSEDSGNESVTGTVNDNGEEDGTDAGEGPETERGEDTSTDEGTKPGKDDGTGEGTEPGENTGTGEGTEPGENTGTGEGAEPGEDTDTSEETEPIEGDGADESVETPVTDSVDGVVNENEAGDDALPEGEASEDGMGKDVDGTGIFPAGQASPYFRWLVIDGGNFTAKGRGNYPRWSSYEYPEWLCYGRISSDSKSKDYYNTTIKNIDKISVSEISSTKNMFYGCKNLESIFARIYLYTGSALEDFDTSEVTDMEGMFSGCSSLRYTKLLVGQGRYRYDDGIDLNELDTAKVTNMSNMFKGCASLRNIDLSAWDTGNVRTMSNMFKDCTSLKNIDLSGLDLRSIKDGGLEGMFSGCTSLISVNLGGQNIGRASSLGNMFSGCTSLTSINVTGLNTGSVTDMSNMFSDCRALGNLDLSSFNTSNVTDMSDMFSGCSALEGLDISGFDMGKVSDVSGFINGCDSLSYICLPADCPLGIALPEGRWYGEDGTEYTEVPAGLPHGIVLYKNGHPGDGSGKVKQLLFVSGITVADKAYDGEPAPYTGTAVVKDSEGNEIQGIGLSSSYSGTLADGKEYAESMDAPKGAGSYKLSFDISGLDESRYTMVKTSFQFSILRREVTITAPSLHIGLGEAVPGLDGLTCEVNGLLEGDKLALAPSLKYNKEAEQIQVNSIASYDIIPYGAQLDEAAAGNYSIKYIKGKLKVGDVPEDEDDLIASGVCGDISWKIDKAGKLTLEGDGDYTKKPYSMTGMNNKVGRVLSNPTWTEGYLCNKIFSAEVNISNITHMQYMFYGCSNLKSVDLSGLDTSKVIDMSNMFFFCSSLESLDLSGFDTSEVQYMTAMFANCSSLKSLDLSSFNTAKVKTMGELPCVFAYKDNGSTLSYDEDEERRDRFGGVTCTEITGMFEGCSSLESLDLSSFNTDGVKKMERMFEGCESLKSLDLSSFNTRLVKSMDSMFEGCSSLESLDLCGFDTGMAGSLSAQEKEYGYSGMTKMFKDCSSLKNLDLSSFNTINVKTMDSMFEGCSSLERLNLRSFTTVNVCDMAYMFKDCSSLESLDLSSFDTSCVGYIILDFMGYPLNNGGSMSGMFSGCTSLKKLDLSGFDTSRVENMSSMFNGCSGLSSLDLSSFNTGLVKSMDSMFEGCSSLISLDLSSFHTRSVTDASNMFSGCASLRNIDLSGFDTGSVTDASNMFSGCASLRNIDLSGFDTRSVTDASNMFSGCASLRNLDLSSFDTSAMTTMKDMFSDCVSLESLDLSGFDMGKAENDGMFSGCRALSLLFTPKNCKYAAALPGEAQDKWTSEDGTVYTEVPAELVESIILYKNAYSEEEGTLTKKTAYVSGISISDKVYDGSANPYTGTAVVTDLEGNTVSDINLVCTYAGILVDGTPYTGTGQEPPSQAGAYTLHIEAAGDDADKYVLYKNSYDFRIGQREIRITAPSVEIEVGGRLPEPSSLKCDITMGIVQGELPEGEEAFTNLSVRYGKEGQDINTSKAGSYLVIPYGAVINSALANNYRLRYETGTLIVGTFGDDSRYDTVDRIDLSGQTLGAAIAKIKSKTYDGYPYEPAIKVTVLENGRKKTLTEGADYRLEYQNNINAGTGTVIVRGNGEYKGRLTGNFTIKPKSVKKLKYIIGNMSTADDRNNPPVYVYDGPKLLKKGTDYTLSGTEKLNGQPSKGVTITVNGTAAQTMEGGSTTANYTGSKNVKIPVYDTDASNIIQSADVYWTIESWDMQGNMNVDITDTPDINNPSYFNGKAKKPSVGVRIGGSDGTWLKKNKDYKVQYKNNKNAGTAYVIVTGKGKYKGKVVKTFKIEANNIAEKLDVIKAISDKTYNGKLQKPSPVVTVDGKRLKKNRDYTVSYMKNLHAGAANAKATVIVTGKGNYKGGVSQTFTIKQQNIKKVSVKGTREGGLTITYGKMRLKENVHYTLQYGAVNKNKVEVTITAIEGGDFTGSVTKKVKIN